MESTYNEIVSLWETAVSLPPPPPSTSRVRPGEEEEDDPFFKLYVEIHNLVKTSTAFDDEVLQSLLTPFLQQTKDELGIQFTLQGFIEYVLTPRQPCCTHYCENPERDSIIQQADSQNQLTITLPLVTFLRCISCGNCGNLRNDHQVCMNFVLEGESCYHCGLYRYEHHACGAFEMNNNNPKVCSACGKDRKEHIEVLHLSCCGKEFVNDGHDFCQHCLFSLTEHLFQPPYFQLGSIEQVTLSIKMNLFMGDFMKQVTAENIQLYQQLVQMVYLPEFQDIASRRIPK